MIGRPRDACPHCHGYGQKLSGFGEGAYDCPWCAGTGWRYRETPATPETHETHDRALKNHLRTSAAPITHRRTAFETSGSIIPDSDFNFHRPPSPPAAASVKTPVPRIDPSDF